MRKTGNLVIAVYTHPEYLPPTLNAIEFLAKEFENIYVVHRNVEGFDWQYPPNVKLLSSGETLSVREAEAKSIGGKIADFLGFASLFAKTVRVHKARSILFYDYLPLLAYRIMKWRLPKPSLLWYHNHDVAEAQYLRKWSLSWFAWKSERWIFPKLDFFSLPSIERKICFPMETLKGVFFFIPNFPARHVYEKYQQKKIPGDTIKILYQGSIGELHGLEEIIGLLDKPIEGKQLRLVLKGFISAEYKEKLQKLAAEKGVGQHLIFLPPTGYKEVITNAQTCHIGIGIHKKKDMMNATLGTASNKIYEYAASGMPVILYDNAHFRESLAGREWVFFTDTSQTSLQHIFATILANYEELSEKARRDFSASLSFEKNFLPVVDVLRHKLLSD